MIRKRATQNIENVSTSEKILNAKQASLPYTKFHTYTNYLKLTTLKLERSQCIGNSLDSFYKDVS